MTKTTLHNVINFRGNREQAFKMAFGFKGGQTHCYTRGCEIFTPISHNLNGVDLSGAIMIQKMHYGEIPVYL